MADDQRTADLYDSDFYLWCQAQGEALRHAGRAGKLDGVDWERLAGEIEDLGKRDLKAALSLTTRIIEHLYLLASSGNQAPRGHWTGEIIAFRGDLEMELQRTVRNKVENDLEKCHLIALRGVTAKLRIEEPHVTVDASVRWTLAQILGEEDDPIG
jgi:hypothetical protein